MNKFTAASLLSKIVLTKAEEEQITVFIKSIVNNRNLEFEFFEYCNKWKLAPWIYIQLGRYDLLNQFSNETQQLFEQVHSKIKNENEKRNKEAVRFLTEFKKNNIDVVILKGNLFAHTVYKDSGYKRMNDFDILIHEKDWDKIQDIYFSLGYIPLGFGWSGEKQKAAKFSHVGMSFISSDYSCIIGSQWGLKSPTTNYTVNIEEAWKTTKAFDFYGIPVKQLSPEYNLLHLILHMGIFKCGIRDCMDVYNYLLAEKIDEHKFHALIKQANAIDKAYFTLKLSNLCSNTLDSLVSAIKPSNSFITRRLKKRIEVYNTSKDFQDSYNDYFQDIEKIVIYFNLFPAFHKKIIFYFIILKLVFAPTKEIALKLSDKSNNGNLLNVIKARLSAPYFVFSLIAQEIGWKFTFLLFTKLFIDLTLSLKNYIIKKESYFDYLKKRGIDPKEIEKAVKKYNNMAKLICITGIDGAGKNTLIDKLASELKSVHVANIWDIMDGSISEMPFKSKKDIDNYLCELTPDSRLLFLAHALKFSIDQALKSDKEYILLNAYYYKYFASEIALDASTELVNALMKSFPLPGKVIYLNINVDVAAKRKKYFSRYECGLVSKPDIINFSDFQHKVSKFWDNYNKSNWITLNASLTPEELFDETLKVIKRP